MKTSPSLFLVGFVLVVGLVLIPFVGVQGQIFRWQNYAGVYETPTPGPGGAALLIDFVNGQPGSYFTVTGFGYIPDTQANVSLNGVDVGSVPVSSNGELQFFLNTSIASLGRYDVLVSQGGLSVSAEVTFFLIPDGDLHPLGGAGAIINVPAGISVIEIYLPVTSR